MHTNLRVDGANCSLCLNEMIDRLRAVDGVNTVNSSISEGCIAIDHDLACADLVDLIGTSLHGVAMAANEIVMTNVSPSVSLLGCDHRSALQGTSLPGTGSLGSETVTEALTVLRSEGYTDDFYATDNGELSCLSCERTMHLSDVEIVHTIRFEGDSNPDDEDIVLALECKCGCKGIYTAAYGPSTPPNDAAVLRQLARVRSANSGDSS